MLDGVPGSGKTETYFETVQTCLDERKQVLILLPEIALTPDCKKDFITNLILIHWFGILILVRKKEKKFGCLH